MNIRTFGLSVMVALPAYLLGCQTVSSQAPLEMTEAQKAIKQAERKDAEDYMPSAMEAANRKLDKAASLLDDASEYKKDGRNDQAETARNEAIKLAEEAKVIANGATKMISDMEAFNSNSGEYLSTAEKSSRSAELEAELAALKAKNNELEEKYSAVNSENENLTNRIPADFRSGKPVAFFATGSSTVDARFRPEIKDLAAVLKENKDLYLTLEGFADPRGSAKLNKRLAKKRLKAVADELEAQGVNKKQIKLVTVGATADESAAVGARSGELQLDRKVTATITSTAH